MMVLGNPEKVSILIASLAGSRQAMAAAAARAQTMSLAALALMLAAAAWLIVGGPVLADDQTAIFVLGALAAWAAVRFALLAGLGEGLAAEGKAITRLETLLGLYEPRRFGPEAEAVLAPPSRKGSPPLRSAARLVDIGLIVLLVAVVSRSDWVRAWAGHLLKLTGL